MGQNNSTNHENSIKSDNTNEICKTNAEKTPSTLHEKTKKFFQENIETWNVHHFLNNIENRMNKIKEDIILLNNQQNDENNNENAQLVNQGLSLRTVNHFFTKSPLSLNKKSNKNDNISKIMSQNETISISIEEINKACYGVTHNIIDGMPNERIMLDYYNQHCLKNDLAIIIFDFDNIDMVNEKFGFASGDQIVIEAGVRIQEYSQWYSDEMGSPFLVFHPDFNVYQYIVIAHCVDIRTIEDYVKSVLMDVARKGFIEQVFLNAGYALSFARYMIGKDKENKIKMFDENSETVISEKYLFRIWYKRALFALRRGNKYLKNKDCHEDRIYRWLPFAECKQLTEKIFYILKEYKTLFAKQSDNDSIEDDNERENNIEVCDNENSKNKMLSRDNENEIIARIEKYIRKGADLRHTLNDGNTVLHEAIEIGNPKLIVILLLYDVDVDVQNNNGISPLTLALNNHNCTEDICVDIALKCTMPNIPDTTNRIPFVYSLSRGFFRVIKILKQKGSNDWRIFLYEIMKHNNLELFEQTLLDCGLPFSCCIDDELGRTLLHLCIVFDNINLLQYCLERGADPDCVDFHQWTPLHYAVLKDNPEMIKLLLQHDADVYKTNNEKQTVIEFASWNKRYQCLALLLNFAKTKKHLPLTQGMYINAMSSNKMGAKSQAPLNPVYLGNPALSHLNEKSNNETDIKTPFQNDDHIENGNDNVIEKDTVISNGSVIHSNNDDNICNNNDNDHCCCQQTANESNAKLNNENMNFQNINMIKRMSNETTSSENQNFNVIVEVDTAHKNENESKVPLKIKNENKNKKIINKTNVLNNVQVI